MKTYGYVRIDYPLPTIKQLKKIDSFNYQKIWIDEENLHVDKELKKMLTECKVDFDNNESVCIVVASLEVFGKTFSKLARLLEFYEKNNVRLICIDENIDTSKDKNFYEIYKNLKTMQNAIHRDLSKKSLQQKKNQGQRLGRPRISNQTIEKINELHELKYDYQDIAEKCDVSLASVYKYVKK